MKTEKWLGLGILIIAIAAIAYFIGQGSSNQSQLTSAPAVNNTNEQPATASAASYTGMVSSCQSIADGNIRNSSFEGDFSYQYDAQPIQATDQINFNASESTCYFTEHIVSFPKVYGDSDPSAVEKDYLYTTALSPNGVMQAPAKGDSEVGGPLPMAYCIISTYEYPTVGSTQTHCVDFEVIQSGGGTNNYHANALGIGNTISQPQYEALVQKYMSSSQ
jgi:uncharacterized protein (UPF0333 family)